MLFDWDDAKHRRNIRDRGFGFDFAARIFEGRVVEWHDSRFDYGEERMIAVGVVEGRFLTVVYTDLDDGARRIIASWPSSRWEREQWPG